MPRPPPAHTLPSEYLINLFWNLSMIEMRNCQKCPCLIMIGKCLKGFVILHVAFTVSLCFLGFWLQSLLKIFGPVETCNKKLVFEYKEISNWCIVQLKSPPLQLSAGLLQWNLTASPGCYDEQLPLHCIFHQSWWFSFSSRMQHVSLWLPEMSAHPRYVSASL